MRFLRTLALYFACGLSPIFAQSSVSPAALYSMADVVFTGRLEKILRSNTGVTARFRPDLIAKGTIAEHAEVLVRIQPGTGCHPFEETHSYLIYALSVGDELWVNPCAGSKLLSMAEEDLRYLHTVNPQVAERCSRARLTTVASTSPIIATAELIDTEDTLPQDQNIQTMRLFRSWCGFAFSSEDAYYNLLSVLKGDIAGARIAVEHPICWDTVTVDGYNPRLSPMLFKEGNILLLFLKQGSHYQNRKTPPGYDALYSSTDTDCGAVVASSESAEGLAEELREHPSRYKHAWLDESLDWIYTPEETKDADQR